MSADQHKGHVADITGASPGIGKATARALHAEGHRVALLARRHDRVETLAGELGNGAIAIEPTSPTVTRSSPQPRRSSSTSSATTVATS